MIDTLPAPTVTTASWIVLPSIGEAAALVPGLTAAARLVVSDDLIPSVPGPMPRPALRKLPAATRAGAAAAYFPACVNRIFGSGPGRPRHPSLPQALVEVSARADKPLWIPDDVAGKCCSTPWSSKGYIRGHEWMAAATCDALWEWSGHGTLPVIIDAASCTNGLLDDVKNYLDDEHRARLERITLLDSIAWCDGLFPCRSARPAAAPVGEPHLRNGPAPGHRAAVRVVCVPAGGTDPARPDVPASGLFCGSRQIFVSAEG